MLYLRNVFVAFCAGVAATVMMALLDDYMFGGNTVNSSVVGLLVGGIVAVALVLRSKRRN
jgi:hypothetical protein